jgi:biotin-dependent carboxylase-like uncharacterized protein
MCDCLDVVRGGAMTTVQDLGRPGFGRLAVPRSGALDLPALQLANRLVGNPEGAAALETTVDGVAIRASRRCQVAVTGADAEVRLDGRLVGWGVPMLVPAGAVLDVGRARRGVRSYLAVSGGIAVDPVLGSRATDLLSGLGPPIVRTGSRLPLGGVEGAPARIDFAPYRLPEPVLSVECYLGPREDRLTPAALALLGSASWTVSARSNRIGLRLEGPALARLSDAELLSEGLVLGSLQLPADGQPVLFLADHPVTGGYPVVGVVPERDVWRCGQAAPGTVLRFRLKRLAAV